MADDSVPGHEAPASATAVIARVPPPVIPVSRFVASARLVLERNLGLLWIGGEVSGCTRAASGHLYFTLKDRNAQVRCVFFRSKAQALAFALRDGLAVEVRATASIYEARGEFQLNVDTVRLAGVGALYERFLQVKAALAAAGLFDPARKRALPAYPRRIGVVTSRHAAALRDVVTTIRKRFPCVPVVVYPASVQGAGAGSEIAAAIRLANVHALTDVLIVCRGGGSLEDLWAFNEEVVARAIHASRLPVVSGVGHETDFTICDFVADIRAATPTAAATLVVPDRTELLRALRELKRHLSRACAHQAQNRAQRLDAAARRLVHPAARLARQAAHAQALGERLARALHHRHARETGRVDAMRVRLIRETRGPLPQAARASAAAQALRRAGRDCIASAAATVDRLRSALELLNPQAVLERGYSIVTTLDGTIVTESRQVSTGASARLRFAKGAATATIDDVDAG